MSKTAWVIVVFLGIVGIGECAFALRAFHKEPPLIEPELPEHYVEPTGGAGGEGGAS